MRVNQMVFAGVVALAGVMLWLSTATAARISDVANTKHNFSKTSGQTVRASGSGNDNSPENEICIFCHTPHGADTSEGPLWNKTLPAGNPYTPYTSSSIDSNIGQVNGPSKLCLSCHDGTIAIGSLRNVRGQERTISMQGTGGGGAGADRMPGGPGVNTGYTRNLGQDLRNDHPISLTYSQSFVNADGEMRNPGDDPIRVRGQNPRPGLQDIHLDSSSQVQCVSCHDPHIRETSGSVGNIKFLRLNRLQTANPDGLNNFLPNSDIICLACHTKAGWETSAHAQQNVANETYTDEAADAREFPRNTEVWESACLACHDTHTVQGSRRLLRAGTTGGTTSLFGYAIKSGGGDPDNDSAIEETCYACHSPNGGGTLNGATEVPDIQTDFQMNRRMPINDQPEVHDIIDADFMESQNNLGNRHAECTDCHNPHRVVKRQVYNEHNGNGFDTAGGTHEHVNNHTNIASGVLRGIWGVEPQYNSNSFHQDPSGYNVKSGQPPDNASANPNDDPDGVGYLTREYQVCLKCHSDYAFASGYDGPPTLGGAGLTPWRTNGMENYTNVAREYNSPTPTHSGEPKSVGEDGGARAPAGSGSWNTNNHRSWHPVMMPTDRNAAARNITTGDNNWLAPFRALGTQTMYCTDCHGSTTTNGVVPAGAQPDGPPWGPHGSNDDFILKGPWSQQTGRTGSTNHLCFKCHEWADYADPNNTTPRDSGFQLDPVIVGGMGGGTGMMDGGGGGMDCMGGGMMCMGGGMGGMGGGGGTMNNLHIFHANQVSTFRCNLCHVAVPHGWKNKNFLVNLNDVGQEGGNASPREERTTSTSTAPFTRSPYYNGAVLKIRQFAASGLWDPLDCGSAGLNGGNNLNGVAWMASGAEACQNPP